MSTRSTFALLTLPLAATLLLTGCGAGGNATSTATASAVGTDATDGWSDTVLTIDFATYNPLSLIIKEQRWLETELGEGVAVTWIQSAGSNKANEALRAGAIDVGSTAGSAALLARSNGSPIRNVLLFSQPEWAAIVVRGDSGIDDVADLAGRSIAATKGTDPYFFLVQALEEAGLSLDDVEVQNLQHADGRAALENGSVDAWAGLDPIMAASQVESGTRLIYRNIDFNTYGFLNATESFLAENPDLAQLVVDAYERARIWAAENPEETVEILARYAGIDPAVAETVLLERTVLDLDPVPGAVQAEVLAFVGPLFVASGDVPTQANVDAALESLFDTTFIERADPGRFDG